MDIAEPQNAAKAALIVFQNLRPQLLQFSSNPATLTELAAPIFGFERNKRTISALGAGPINDLMKIMKNSKAPKPLIGRLRRVLIPTYFDESLVFRPGWEVWRGLITRFHLWEIIPFAAWDKIVTALSTRHIHSPIELTTITFTEASALDYDRRWGGNLVLLWQSALCSRDEGHIRP